MALDGAEPKSSVDVVLFIREPPLGIEKLPLFRKMLLGAAAVTDLSADIIRSRTAHNPPELDHRPKRLSELGVPIESPSKERVVADESVQGDAPPRACRSL